MLILYDDAAPYARRGAIHDHAAIAAELLPSGVRLERWNADIALPRGAGDGDILAAYGADIARLKARGGYRSEDVVRLTPGHPQRADMRAKFLAEHVHDEDEVRFFVEGAGLFYIRHGGLVRALLCTAGDLIVLPAGLRHWFDTGARPRFTAIRLFTTPEGWAARFTEDAIAGHIPLLEDAR
ncbi:MAG: cupin [Sphingobium sp.]